MPSRRTACLVASDTASVVRRTCPPPSPAVESTVSIRRIVGRPAAERNLVPAPAVLENPWVIGGALALFAKSATSGSAAVRLAATEDEHTVQCRED